MSSIPVFDQSYLHGKEEVRKASRARKADGSLLENIFRVIVVLLFLVLAGQLLFHFVISPRLVVKSVKVTMDSALSLSSQDVISLSGITSNDSIFSLDEAAVAGKIMAEPSVKTAVVEKVFPDQLNILVKGRVPLAVSYPQVQGRTVPVVFDEEGIVFQVGPMVDVESLPVISGITYTDVRPGVQLAPQLHGFLGDLKALSDTSPDLYSLISEVKFDKKNNTDFEALIFPSTHRIRVRIGNTIDSGLLKSMVMFFALIDGQDFFPSIDELDLRTGELVYTVREE